ncbi:DNA kinase/phosphatase Pnk1 [Xylaria bambusicola]|uniref:DNA kinase/phosphatase Pnk1 n=1 Tax=Xylaria bambusicola TaxID=326684 RepID=UPI002007EF3B|nr:DNA kinase/phosphatase Pnk1 [Xylaria bambusicola]KAI0513132.1 DNA kinase/phosphatase Pnk1 [Xylaria bambusicola]
MQAYRNFHRFSSSKCSSLSIFRILDKALPLHSKLCIRLMSDMAGSPPPSKDGGASKRKATDKPISPPPVKRKGQSAISKGAVASFFTPTSQKPKDRTVWMERGKDSSPATLLVGRFEPESGEPQDRKKRRKIAAFDLDSTLIVTSSGKKFGNDPADWKWWDPSVPTRLRKMYTEEDYRVVIISNQAGLTLHVDPNSKGPKNAGKAKVANFKQKCAAILAQLNIPTSVYAATARDEYRKPRIGMWKELCNDYDIPEDEVDLQNSVFVGDAGGRTARVLSEGGATAKDFSCSDRNFAHNVGIAYKTPEEFFLDEPPREFARDFDLATYPYEQEEEGKEKEVLFEKTNKRDIVLFCGPPGAGKSTFYWKHLKPLGYERVNQDTLKSRAKCFKAAAGFLEDGCPIVIDNTNPDLEGRKEWIELSRKHDLPIRCVWFKIPKALCEHNDAVRALNKCLNPETRSALPPLAFNGFFSRLREPTVKEGFQHVLPIEFKFRGTEEEYAIWAQYWS